MSIVVTYSSIDGARKRRSFKTVAKARAFAIYWVGETPEMGLGYAVAGDGVGKVTVTGCTLKELFEKPKAPATQPPEEPFWIVSGRMFATKEEAFKESRELLAQGYGYRVNVEDEFLSAYPVEGPYLPSEIWQDNEP